MENDQIRMAIVFDSLYFEQITENRTNFSKKL